MAKLMVSISSNLNTLANPLDVRGGGGLTTAINIFETSSILGIEKKLWLLELPLKHF